MTNCTASKRKLCSALLPFALVMTFVGCSSNTTKHARTDSKAERSSSTAAANDVFRGIDLNCVMDHIQNPPEAFHYSYHKQSSNPVEEQADITPQTIDGSFKNSDVARPLHGVRSDPQSWQTAWSGLMGISGMSSTVAIIRSSSAITKEGPERMNGYDATRLSIDTTKADPAEQGLYRTVLGSGGFEKGTAWVTEQGCPVKLVLDSEQHSNNGDVDKIHYEITMVRK